MERLSSCYFCGDAVDASVAEYSLVESERYDIDTDHRIVLCPTCRRKLTDVIERVVSAVFDDDRDPEAVAAGPEDDPMTATDVQAVEGDSLEVTDDPLVDVDGTENGATEAEDDGENEDAVAEGGAEAATVRSEGGDESDSEMGDNETSDGDGWAGEADEDDGTVEANDSEGETVVGAAEEEGVETVEDDEAETEDETATDTAEDDEAETTDYEKAEFNKIVRLLQNREFPVEIDELVVVASSAYGIDEPTCHAVIRALVDRGVVEDRGDELVRN